MCKLQFLYGVLVIILICQTFEALKVYRRLVHEQSKGTIVQHSFHDGRLVYIACKNKKSVLECNVSREKTAYQNETYSCECTLKTEQQDGSVDFRIFLEGLGKDKVLVGWEDNGENKFIKYSIINLNGCNSAETKLMANKNQSLKDYQVLIYDDSYSVIFENENLCAKKLCKLTVDADGKVISGPESFFENIGHPRYFKAVQADTTNKRYFFIRRKNAETSYHLVNADGSTKMLTQVKNMLPPYYTTTSHNLFGICYTIQLSSIFDTETKCVQYDDEGNLKLELMTKGLNRTKMMRYMHNLPQGGFIFIDEDYSNCEPDHCSVRFVAEKWNAEGKNMSSLDLGLRCQNAKARAWTSFFENEVNNYCLAWTCRTDNLNQLHITVKCFNDTDFS